MHGMHFANSNLDLNFNLETELWENLGNSNLGIFNATPMRKVSKMGALDLIQPWNVGIFVPETIKRT